MKIGFSLGRCVRDIVRGEVTTDDVAFLITATSINTTEQLFQVIQMYTYEDGYLLGLDEDHCQRVALELWNTNRLLQPRKQGLHRHKQPEDSVWVDIFPTKLSDNEVVKSAWDNYRLMLHMVENLENQATEIFKV